MRHDLTETGYGVRLRPVTEADAAFIHNLRTHPANSAFIGDTAGGVDAQRAWIQRYFERPGDYYFLVERLDGTPVGTAGIYDLNQSGSSAEWGRWVLLPDSQAAAASLFLVYRLAFERLGLSEVTCKIVAENEKVIALHERTGMERVGFTDETVNILGRVHSQYLYRFPVTTWTKNRSRIESLARIGQVLMKQSQPAAEATP